MSSTVFKAWATCHITTQQPIRMEQAKWIFSPDPLVHSDWPMHCCKVHSIQWMQILWWHHGQPIRWTHWLRMLTQQDNRKWNETKPMWHKHGLTRWHTWWTLGWWHIPTQTGPSKSNGNGQTNEQWRTKSTEKQSRETQHEGQALQVPNLF